MVISCRRKVFRLVRSCRREVFRFATFFRYCFSFILCFVLLLSSIRIVVESQFTRYSIIPWSSLLCQFGGLLIVIPISKICVSALFSDQHILPTFVFTTLNSNRHESGELPPFSLNLVSNQM